MSRSENILDVEARDQDLSLMFPRRKRKKKKTKTRERKKKKRAYDNFRLNSHIELMCRVKNITKICKGSHMFA